VPRHDLVFLIDIDNTLIDHDRLKERVGEWVDHHPGASGSRRLWEIYEQARVELDVVDFLEVARRYGETCPDPAVGDQLREMLWNFPFPELMFPGTIESLRHISALGTPVILCDGHEPFQRRKLEATGVADIVGDNVLVCRHKEECVDDIRRLFPASHYVMIDDKPRIHAALRDGLGQQVTTILVLQGSYALSPQALAFPRADIEVESTAALALLSAEDISRGAALRGLPTGS
jgi:hypothetical protein